MMMTKLVAIVAVLVTASGFAVESVSAVPTADVVVGVWERWPKPSELRSKKLINTGIYSLQGELNPRFLLEHPDFVVNHPFDGITLLVPIDPKWCNAEGLEAGVLDALCWTSKAVPYEAVQNSVADLKRIAWGHLTDNFLWYRMIDGSDHQFEVDFTQDGDWAAVLHNAALLGRVCKEAGLKGFMLDTEQYGQYTGERGPYPMGRDTPELLRQRGTQWIKAVQAEYPAITIMISFGWSPDLDQVGFLAGVRPFLNGVLEGIEKPARLIHGYENTFYYGQAAGTRYTVEGFPGDRARYEVARNSLREWRSFSTAPEKYDRFVEVGMAAWLESDPWNLWMGWPSGSVDTFWSNVPLALAYSDEYVWCWSEHTHYGHTMDKLNPFLASLSNQTFNTGKEAVGSLTEDFTTNPLLRGWYFDFNMLEAGRKVTPDQAVATLSSDSVPYSWSPDDRFIRVLGTWMTGLHGDKVANLGQQRRRYVHPISFLTSNGSFRAEFDFHIEDFGSDPANPIVLGFFNSEEPVNRQSITLQIGGLDSVSVTFVGEGEPWTSRIPLECRLTVDTPYRFAFNYDGTRHRFCAGLTNIASSTSVVFVDGNAPASVGGFQLDEVGVAQWDANPVSTPLMDAHRYRLKGVSFRHGD
jgi:hypothetical protein